MQYEILLETLARSMSWSERGGCMKRIVKIGTFDRQGMPTGWYIENTEHNEVGYCLGLDMLFPGSVDVNGCEIVEWTLARSSNGVA